MRRAGFAWALAWVVAGSGCGGSTDTGGSGGTGGSTGGSGNVGGSTGGTGGSGNLGGITGGTGGCATTTCGPSDTPCCKQSAMCSTGMTSCTCGSTLTWSCITEGGGSAGIGGIGGIGGAAGSGGVTGCSGAGGCAPGLTCCAGSCVNTLNDPYNCGSCGSACASNPPYCSGTCTTPPCSLGKAPPPGYFCCGQTACATAELCCDVQGLGPSKGPECFTPTQTQPTCPVGCPTCQ